MKFVLKRPFKSPIGAQSLITEVTLRELLADDVVEGFSAAEKTAKQFRSMIERTASILPEELGKMGAADYLELQGFVAYQLNGGDPAAYGKVDPDPKATATPST
jgi:hypothetical protein